jgi:hypothetical protein
MEEWGTTIALRLTQSSLNKKQLKISLTFVSILVKALRNIAHADKEYPFSCATLEELRRLNA